MLNLPVIEESVFLLIDMQERLVKAMSDIESCLNRQQMLLAGAGLLGWRVIVTEQYPRGLGPTVPESPLHCRRERRWWPKPLFPVSGNRCSSMRSTSFRRAR